MYIAIYYNNTLQTTRIDDLTHKARFSLRARLDRKIRKLYKITASNSLDYNYNMRESNVVKHADA